MVDFTTIQANPIPLSIFELQNTNSALKVDNKVLRSILIVGGVIISLYVAHKIITHLKAENESNDKK